MYFLALLKTIAEDISTSLIYSIVDLIIFNEKNEMYFSALLKTIAEDISTSLIYSIVDFIFSEY